MIKQLFCLCINISCVCFKNMKPKKIIEREYPLLFIESFLQINTLYLSIFDAEKTLNRNDIAA